MLRRVAPAFVLRLVAACAAGAVTVAVALFVHEATPLAAGADPSLGTLRQQVRRAKAELAGQPSLQSYHQSQFQPSEIVERIHLLESEQAWAELCRELASLPDDELELFEDAIRRPEHARRLACAPALVRRIDAHWKEADRRLAAAHPIAPGPLPSIAVAVDVRRDEVLTDGKLPAGQIALTFDDGPHPTRTPRVLQILADAGIKATFFQIGRNAAAYPDVARRVLAAGHTVGSHTFSHPNMSRITEPHAETEVESGDASVSLALGMRPGELPFFRFPYGAKTPVEQGFVQRRGNTTVFWNMDSEDWKVRDPHRLFLNVLSELDRARGGIILFHDIHEQTVIVLPHVLAELRARRMKTVVFIAAESVSAAGGAAPTPPHAAPWTR
jgi:peptidoglycan/xylan/chitin deacetylase (PgdA/CDA1 family)